MSSKMRSIYSECVIVCKEKRYLIRDDSQFHCRNHDFLLWGPTRLRGVKSLF